MKIFAEHSSPGIFTLKFHISDHIAVDLCRFCFTLSVPDASQFRHKNAHIETSYRGNSRLVKNKNGGDS